MNMIFTPGIKAMALFGAWGRVVLIVLLFLVPLLISIGYAAQPWAMPAIWGTFMVAAYAVASLVVWGQSGMSRLSRTLERIALGDLTAHVQHRDDAGADAERLWTSIDSMTDSLGEIVTQVNASCGVIVNAARAVADGYANLSERTQEQASTLEETASGMEELSSTVRQNADSCRKANGLAAEASGKAADSAESMRSVTETMGRIERGSKRVAEVIGVIEGIAFQTNILALNAAVEAARAGEQGRGFAVVAAEVRDLAQKSAAAAKEIRALISESVGAVSEGAKRVNGAAETIDVAVQSVHDVSAVIREIAAASGEQSAGVDEINKSIVRLESVTQQNASLVEQAASAAMSFEEEARRLAHAIGVFKIDHDEDRNAAVELVQRAAAHLGRVGARAFDDFETADFIHGDNYILVLDMDCRRWSSGRLKGGRGVDMSGEQDADGRFIARELVATAKARSRGWVDYRALNPVTRRPEPKSTYFERVGDYLIGCGIYRPETEDSARAPLRSLPALPRRARALPR